MGGVWKQSNELQPARGVSLNSNGAPLGHYIKIMGLFWGILRTMEDHEKQLGAYINMMIYNGFQWYLVVFYSLKYWWRRRESNPRPQILCLQLYMRSLVN